MEHSWRHGPIQGNVCPTCSISHFPFCTPHFSLDRNPTFHVETNDHPFHRPDFDHRGSADLHGLNPDDGFVKPRSWVRNGSLDCDPYGQLQTRNGGSTMFNYKDDFASYNRASDCYMSSGNRNNKRMRVYDTGSGVFSDEYHQCPGRSVDDERRLKLVRDHGVMVGGSLQGNVNSGYFHGRSLPLPEKKFSNVDGMKNGKFDDLLDDRSFRAPIPPINKDSSFFDNGFSSTEREGSSVQQYTHSNTHGFPLDIGHGAFGIPSGKNAFDHSTNVEPPESGRGQAESRLHPSSDGYGCSFSGHDADDQGWQSQDLSVLHGMGWDDGKFSASSNDGPNQQLYSYPSNWQVLAGRVEVYSRQRSGPYNQLQQPDTVQYGHNLHSPVPASDGIRLHEFNIPSQGNRELTGYPNLPGKPHYAPPNLKRQGVYSPIQSGSGMGSVNVNQIQASRSYGVMPPLPTSPPPPLPVVPPAHASSGMKPPSSPPKVSSLLFPIPPSISAHVPLSYPAPEACSSVQPYFHNKSHFQASSGFFIEETQAMHGTSSNKSVGDGQPFLVKQLSSDKPKVFDASHLFRQPFLATRPDHIVIILRGLPGSGKSYLAKMLRDLEVENGGNAPRIHSMDEYFMTEVEKVEESGASKSSSSVRCKYPVMKKVMEYCYEPEMEEAYRSSMLKAYRKTLEEGNFTFVIVDDRNLRVADFAQFWAIAKRSGYEVYLLEATYKDPAGCAARNVHGFTQEDIQKMARQWEEAPSMYWQLDTKSLFHGDGLKDSRIQEVDMDVEEGDIDEGLPASQDRNSEKIMLPSVEDCVPDGASSPGRRWVTEQEHPAEVKELGRSKWLDDLDEDDSERTERVKGSLNALSGLIQAYSKGGKAVQWGDRISCTGFSIGAAKKASSLSLVIGPGAGYNLSSNPLPEEENPVSAQDINESKRHGVFQERLRAERESFKAVFDRRRQRIGLDVEEE